MQTSLIAFLTGSENSRLYYIRQPVTNSVILGRVLVLTRFEQRTTTVLLQLVMGPFPDCLHNPLAVLWGLCRQRMREGSVL